VIFEADELRTGADGRLGVTLKDDTRISLGPGSEVHVDRFVYAPAEARLGLVLKVVRGVMAYVSGRIAKLSPDAIRLETPAAVVLRSKTSLPARRPVRKETQLSWPRFSRRLSPFCWQPVLPAQRPRAEFRRAGLRRPPPQRPRRPEACGGRPK